MVFCTAHAPNSDGFFGVVLSHNDLVVAPLAREGPVWLYEVEPVLVVIAGILPVATAFSASQVAAALQG
jgi:uncharacterized membrane protein YjdF